MTSKIKPRKTDIPTAFRDLLCADPYRAPFTSIQKQLSSCDSGRRRALAGLSETALRSPLHRKEQPRIGVVKLLVALLPESFPAVSSLLRSSTPTSMNEVHFSLFRFLEEAQFIDRHPSLRQRVLREVVAYHYRAKSDPALAAWMAGDLLGEHWAPRAGWPALMRLARRARHPAGRIAAVHGLRHAIGKAKRNRRSALLRVLNDVASQDSSRKVRNSARAALASRIVI